MAEIKNKERGMMHNSAPSPLVPVATPPLGKGGAKKDQIFALGDIPPIMRTAARGGGGMGV